MTNVAETTQWFMRSNIASDDGRWKNARCRNELTVESLLKSWLKLEAENKIEIGEYLVIDENEIIRYNFPGDYVHYKRCDGNPSTRGCDGR